MRDGSLFCFSQKKQTPEKKKNINAGLIELMCQRRDRAIRNPAVTPSEGAHRHSRDEGTDEVVVSSSVTGHAEGLGGVILCGVRCRLLG